MSLVMIELGGLEFKKSDIERVYPAAMVKTGYGDEITPISLEWADSQKDNSEVKIVKYAIFIHLKDKSVTPFYYRDKDELQIALDHLSKQF